MHTSKLWWLQIWRKSELSEYFNPKVWATVTSAYLIPSINREASIVKSAYWEGLIFKTADIGGNTEKIPKAFENCKEVYKCSSWEDF